mgnify:FL=1
MRILWVSTSPMGPASRILKMPSPGSSGGWIQSEYEALVADGTASENEMFFLCASRSVSAGEIKVAESSEGKAFCVNLPGKSFGIEPPRKLAECISRIIENVSPDIIHIWGTESCISYGAAKFSPGIKKVVFLQGIIGIHNRYKGGYLEREVENRRYLRGIPVKKRLVAKVKKYYFSRQKEYEKFILSVCKNVVLDSNFSASYCLSVNDNINCHYHYLKPAQSYLLSDWNISDIENNSIFTVFGQSSEKGLHQLLKAAVIVKRHFPDLKIIVPGPFNCENGKLKDRKFLSLYEMWLAAFIAENGLTESVVFVGKLNTEQMIYYEKKCNLFVNPSCMEVHALSLREAMSVGMPCISSLCGSVEEFLVNGENGFVYRYEEYEMLAFLIEKLLKEPSLCERLSENAKKSMRSFIALDDLSLRSVYEAVVASDDVNS